MVKWLLGFVMLCTVSTLTTAQTDLPWKVIGSGGTIGAQGNNRVLSATIGQVLIGVSIITDGSAISQGFWLPIDNPTSVEDDVNNIAGDEIGNYPNPFSTTTTISIKVPVDGPVTVRIFDLVGNLVRTLEAELSAAGGQDIHFDGLTQYGDPLASGSYLYEVAAESSTGEQFRRMHRMSIVR
jgi:hypothetical protein